MADEKPLPTWMTFARTGLDIAKDGVLLFVVVLLLFMPKTIDGVLTRAGFTRASILRFDWEKQLDDAAQETEDAQ